MQHGLLTKDLIFVIIGLCIGASTLSGLSRTVENTRYVKENDSFSEITRCYDPPVACFQWDPYQPEVGENVTFDASCSEGDITSYSWYYSCGAHFPIPLGTGKLMTTSFNEPCSDGAYLIGLTVDGPGGSDSISHYVTVVTNKNNPPNTPSTPIGRENGRINVGYNYTSMTFDPDGDQVYYLWDWGDGIISVWDGPYNPGATCEATHTWSEKGDYSIKVKAKDTSGAESSWSDPLPITMPYPYKPIPPFLDLFFQRFLNAFPLLQY